MNDAPGSSPRAVLEWLEPAATERGAYPFGVKANFAIAGRVTGAGTLARRRAGAEPTDAFAVRALRRHGGQPTAITTMDELAYGFTGRNHHHGDLANPHDTARLAGGSSSGSAVAVATGTVPVALGSDTNGSARVPAAACGVWGLRLSMDGRTTAGLLPLAPSLDAVGVLARSAARLVAASAAIAPWWHDGADQRPAGRVVVVTGLGAAASSAAAVRAVATALSDEWACEVDCAELGWLEPAREAARVITGAEAAAAHAPLLDEAEAGGLGPFTRQRLEAGRLIAAADLDEARALRAGLRAQLDVSFAHADLLVTSTLAVDPPALDAAAVEVDGQMIDVNTAMGLHTAPFSLVGAPALAVPVTSAGAVLPGSIQLVARPGNDALLHRAALLLERSGVASARVRA